MSIDRQGFVGVFPEPLERRSIEGLIGIWLERYGSVEQAAGRGAEALTIPIRASADVAWNGSIEFRVSCGEQFAWVYITPGHRVIETSGLTPQNGDSLCHDVLVDLPGCREIVNDHDDRRLDQLEAEGLM